MNFIWSFVMIYYFQLRWLLPIERDENIRIDP